MNVENEKRDPQLVPEALRVAFKSPIVRVMVRNIVKEVLLEGSAPEPVASDIQDAQDIEGRKLYDAVLHAAELLKSYDDEGAKRVLAAARDAWAAHMARVGRVSP